MQTGQVSFGNHESDRDLPSGAPGRVGGYRDAVYSILLPFVIPAQCLYVQRVEVLPSADFLGGTGRAQYRGCGICRQLDQSLLMAMVGLVLGYNNKVGFWQFGQSFDAGVNDVSCESKFRVPHCGRS